MRRTDRRSQDKYSIPNFCEKINRGKRLKQEVLGRTRSLEKRHTTEILEMILFSSKTRRRMTEEREGSHGRQRLKWRETSIEREFNDKTNDDCRDNVYSMCIPFYQSWNKISRRRGGEGDEGNNSHDLITDSSLTLSSVNEREGNQEKEARQVIQRKRHTFSTHFFSCCSCCTESNSSLGSFFFILVPASGSFCCLS